MGTKANSPQHSALLEWALWSPALGASVGSRAPCEAPTCWGKEGPPQLRLALGSRALPSVVSNNCTELKKIHGQTTKSHQKVFVFCF